jgi:hypothetical protein
MWVAAYMKLRAENPCLAEDYHRILAKDTETPLFPSKPAEMMSTVVARKLNEMKEKEWSIRWGNKSVKLREQVDRIVKVMIVFRDTLSPIPGLDPLHAGLPWAGVCIILSVSEDIRFLLYHRGVMIPAMKSTSHRYCCKVVP